MGSLVVDDAERKNTCVVGGDTFLDMMPCHSIVKDPFCGFRVSDGVQRGAVVITGHHTPVTIVIDRQTYEADINFLYATVQYTFRVVKWSGRGMWTFLNLFHEHEDRDPNMFGSIDGVLTGSQKMSCVLRASIDVMMCLSKITTHMKSSVLDYAVYYRERKGSCETYSKYITAVTCHNIVHAHFTCAYISWPVIEF